MSTVEIVPLLAIVAFVFALIVVVSWCMAGADADKAADRAIRRMLGPASSDSSFVADTPHDRKRGES